MSGLRPLAAPFVAAAPAGARVRTRLRVSAQDEAVLWAATGPRAAGADGASGGWSRASQPRTVRGRRLARAIFC